MAINLDENLDGIIMCAIGMILCFRGRTLVGPTLSLAAFVLTCGVLMMIFYYLVP